jgi:hypothetical protein
VCKVRKDGSIASDLHVHIDDMRTTGKSEKEGWAASQRVSSVLASLELQDAARRRRSPKMEAGAWN